MLLRNNPAIYLIGRLWKYAEGNRKKVVLYVSMFVIANGIGVLWPLTIAKLLNVVQERGITNESIPTLLFYLSAFFFISISFWVFHGPARLIEEKNAFLVRANYKKYLLDGVMALPTEWHADHHSGDTIDKVEKGTKALYKFSEDTSQIIESVVRLVSSYIVLTYFNHYSGFIVFVVVVFAITIITQFDKVLIKQYKTIYGAENKISEKIFDSISNITTVIILRIEKLITSSIYKKIMEPLGLVVKNNRINETKWFLVSVCSNLMTVFVLGSYFFANLNTGNIILVGTVFALYGYVDRISDVFFRFAYMYGDIVQQRASVANAEEISNEFSEIKKVKPVVLNANWKELEIKNLSFSYHPEKSEHTKGTENGVDLHLDNVSMTIRNGARIALIGESGSGKTTFLKIIRELYRPRFIKLYLDGESLKEGFKSISSDIALIPQDPEIFSTTIRENITMGINHESAYIKKFTDMACFSDVIRRLPNKIDSNIFEKGVNLSGGEKQRLALARGLMACDDKSIILLDEPTSSVDTKNELKIFQNIFEKFKKKSIIASVHRLHLLALFEEIHFFREGKIIASGSFDELLKNSAEFQEVWQKYQSINNKR
jgi:ABC-type multidrug transport system fused ATPase/permease subunit